MSGATAYDDFLGLDRLALGHLRLVVLTGCSGSGKSTTLAHLLGAHPDFARRRHSLIERHTVPGRGAPALSAVLAAQTGSLSEVVAVDELLEPADLPSVARLLRRGHVVVAASHLPAAWWLPFRVLWPTRALRTDRDPGKIARHLERLGVTHSHHSVALFCRRWGANFTDCEIVLEWDGGRDFDRALARFLGCCEIGREADSASPGAAIDFLEVDRSR